MEDDLTDRVETLERAITGEEYDLSALSTDADALDRVSKLEDRVEEIETQIEELEAATQALRGYVGNIRAVNEDVENRAETALSKVETLDKRLTAEGPGNTAVAQETERQPRNQSTAKATAQPTSSQRPASEQHGPSGQQSETVAGGTDPERKRPSERGESASRDRTPVGGRDDTARSHTDRSGAETRESLSNDTMSGRRDTTATQSRSQDGQPPDSTAAVHHCDNCGQQTSLKDEGPPTDARQSKSRRHTGGGAAEPGTAQTPADPETTAESIESGAGFEDIRTDDPLVSDGRDDEGGTLDRFRNLL